MYDHARYATLLVGWNRCLLDKKHYIAESEQKNHAGFLSDLYRQYQKSLRRFFAGKLSGGASPDDAVQQVFLRTIIENNRRPIEKPRAFLYVAASNLVKDERRKERKKWLEKSENTYEQISCTRPQPDRIMEARQDVERLREALSELDPKHRRAFILHRFENLTYEQIAEEMNISASSVQNYISLAMAHSCARLGKGR